jgi:hypothetical protein
MTRRFTLLAVAVPAVLVAAVVAVAVLAVADVADDDLRATTAQACDANQHLAGLVRLNAQPDARGTGARRLLRVRDCARTYADGNRRVILVPRRLEGCYLRLLVAARVPEALPRADARWLAARC